MKGFGSNGPGKPMRSSTMKHIDILFNSMMCLIGFLGVQFSEAMSTAISISFQRIQGLIISDPGAAIGELKRSSKLYLEYIRGPEVNSDIANFETHGHTEATFTNLEAVTTALKSYPLLSSVIALRRVLYGSYGFGTLILYDRVVYAILSIHRLIVLPPVNDFSSITRGSKEITATITDPEMTAALSNLGITPASFKAALKEASAGQQHMIMSSAGPNGPATWTAYSDAVALLQDSTLFTALRTYAEKTGLSRFINDLISVSAVPTSDPTPGTPVYSGRIHTFEEWGGKTRNVAIVDYWTQLILTPLHDTIFSFLKPLSTDATFDQDGACAKLKAWTTNDNAVLHSFDLTAATDRLPAALQARVLSYLLSDTAIGAAWWVLLQHRAYRTVDYQLINYAVGLPMGSKSNWAMLALVHHIIIQVAAMRAKDTTSGYSLSNPNAPAPDAKSTMTPAMGVYSAYVVCGDDSTMHGSGVAAAYRSLMEGLGLEINVFKSILPGNGLLSAVEFCKRVFINGYELTTIPVKLIVKTTMNGRLAPQLQSEVLKRDLNLAGANLLSWLAALIDQESFSFLVILNLLPRAITGLFGISELPAGAPKLATLLDNTVHLDDSKLVQGYTYTAAIEELKRLDALLRTTAAVQAGIEQHLLGFDQIDLDDLGWEGTDTNVKVLEQLKNMKHEIGYSHPVVQAAQAETTRIINLLAQLAAGDSTVSSMARLRLLDSFRNALVSAWSDPQAARAQADRTLVQKTLVSVADLVAMTINHTRAGKAAPATLSFTTMISYLSRLWTVRWDFSSVVTINTVTSRVLPNAKAASTRAEAYSKDIKVLTSLRSTISSKTRSTS